MLGVWREGYGVMPRGMKGDKGGIKQCWAYGERGMV